MNVKLVQEALAPPIRDLVEKSKLRTVGAKYDRDENFVRTPLQDESGKDDHEGNMFVSVVSAH
jgi:hypothetical protein